MLEDKFKRKLNYLRVSLTDKCNLRCGYCVPPEGVHLLAHDEVLRNEEFVRMVDLFAGLGVWKVRFTGGEPLVRKGFIDIISQIRELHPELELCLTTNGTLLGGYLEALGAQGVRKLNVSLDTLNRERYRSITGRDQIQSVLTSIDKALELGEFNIKINAVLFRETLEELPEMMNFAGERGLVLRFIERMPFLVEGKTQHFLSADELTTALGALGELTRNREFDTSVAVMYELRREGQPLVKIGIIPPMTHKFCSSCNRLRLTCDGMLKTCLYSQKEYDLKTPYRQDMGDEALKKIIIGAVNEKPLEHGIDCVEYGSQGCASVLSIRTMSKIGG